MRQALFLAAMLFGVGFNAQAQTPTPDGATLFLRQCGTCHSLKSSDPPRQGPNLAGVIGRPVGSIAGFNYSPGYATAGFTWDEARLDPYLTNPQAVIPGSIMMYRQANAGVRHAIIEYLKDQH